MLSCSPAETEVNLCITRAASTPRLRTSRPIRRRSRNFRSGTKQRFPSRDPDHGPMRTLNKDTSSKAARNLGCSPKMPSMMRTALFGSFRMLPVFSWMVPVLKQNFGSSTGFPVIKASRSCLILSMRSESGSSKLSSPFASRGWEGSARALKYMSHSKGRASQPRACKCSASRALKVVFPLDEGPATTTTQDFSLAAVAMRSLSSPRKLFCIVSACKATWVCSLAFAASLHSFTPTLMGRGSPSLPNSPGTSAERSTLGPRSLKCPAFSATWISQGTPAREPGSAQGDTAGVRKTCRAPELSPLRCTA
mmetsp:Transcript_80990/g.194279  ORF Transcript_80990/g.194279 Transcript_80990/m.194279 type:complete len:308 (+) Transcript_80990:372-1295(+)